jgi:hypothetical protein
VQRVQSPDDVPEVHSVHAALKEAVNDHDFRRVTVLAELVRRLQYVPGLQWRTHGGEGVRHVVAEPTCGNSVSAHTDSL